MRIDFGFLQRSPFPLAQGGLVHHKVSAYILTMSFKIFVILGALLLIVGFIVGCDLFKPVSLEIAYINAPTQVSVGQQFVLEVGIRYSTVASAEVLIQVYEHAGPLLAQEARLFQGAGVAVLQFYLTAPSTVRYWQLNVHLFRRDVNSQNWIQLEIKSVVINVQSVVQPSQFYYLFPPVVHLTPGERSVHPIKIIDDSGREIRPSNVVFHVYSDLVSISSDGYITALRQERVREHGASITATIEGQLAANSVTVRVLSTRYDFAFGWITTEHTALYYPVRVKGENIESYVMKFEIPRINELAYTIQHSIIRTIPYDGARQIFAIEFGEGDENSPCGLAGNPIRLGWNITGGEWSNCFLVPFLPPRSPQWTVFYHELGHNFTLENSTFSDMFDYILQEYGEGLATALGLMTIETILREGRINNDTRASLELLYNRDVQNFLTKYERWVKSHIPFSNLSQLERNDIVDGIFFYWASKVNDFGVRFFKVFWPQYNLTVHSIIRKLGNDVDRHTLFAALVSAAARQDLLTVFRDSYGFPVNTNLFYEAYNTFLNLME
ncbi:MAG: hypothetical protein QXY39_06000 [Thermofilaceae archaeon]